MAEEGDRRHSVTRISEEIMEQEKDSKKPKIVGMSPRRYLKKSSLHVLRYVTDRSMTWFERSLFAIAFTFLFCAAGWQVHIFWVKWSASSSISITPKIIKVTDIPFPAVTVCNMNLAKKSVVEQMAPNSDEYEIAQQICSKSTGELGKVTTISQYRQALLKVMQPCQDMVKFCQFFGLRFNCTIMFKPVLTDVGVCCNFNMIPENTFDPRVNNWNMDIGFKLAKQMHDPFSYPRPAGGAGVNAGLRIALYADTNEFYCSSTRSEGFLILFHAPHERPRMMISQMIPISHDVRFIITPIIEIVAPTISLIPMESRNCCFDHECHLPFFRSYAKTNCLLECQMNFLLHHCNCTRPFLPVNRTNIHICGQTHYSCAWPIIRAFELNPMAVYSCMCPNSCSEMSYSAAMSLSKFTKLDLQLPDGTYEDGNEVTFIDAFFTELDYRAYRKNLASTDTEFYSNVGGLIAFFLGISLFSVVELVYLLVFGPTWKSQANPKPTIFKDEVSSSSQQINPSSNSSDNLARRSI